VIGLGANLGDKLATFEAAFAALAQLGRLEAISSLYETAPVGGPVQPDYFNAAARLGTSLLPAALLQQLLRIERNHGRQRTGRWAPRSLDLDILWIEGITVNEPGLQVPHPRLIERSFALLPLLDVMPEAKDPITGEAYRDLELAGETDGVRLHGVVVSRADSARSQQPHFPLWRLC
jgi:2-amino-4-hydroxy-6-hydroxymethyldihydropteridine diphosphokinase